MKSLKIHEKSLIFKDTYKFHLITESLWDTESSLDFLFFNRLMQMEFLGGKKKK